MDACTVALMKLLCWLHLSYKVSNIDIINITSCSKRPVVILHEFVYILGELGDYDPEIHIGNYVSDFKILLKQTEAIEEKAMEMHQKQLKGQSQSQVENTFLKLSCQLDTYGVDPHPVKVILLIFRGRYLKAF